VLLVALFGAFFAFRQIATPSNLPSPQTPSFALQGFQVHKGGYDTDTGAPVYMAETVTLRPGALIRFTPGFDASCEVYELTGGAKPKRFGPLPLAGDPDPDNLFPARKGKEIKLLAAMPDAEDIQKGDLEIDQTHRTIGVACVPSKTDGTVLYSELYSVDAPAYTEPTTT
jgi:hypothetical protein